MQEKSEKDFEKISKNLLTILYCKQYNIIRERENKELQEVVDVILQALLEMEERFNKKFDEIDKWFDKFEEKVKVSEGHLPLILRNTKLTEAYYETFA